MPHLLEQGKWILEEFSKGLAGVPAEAPWQMLDAAPAISEETTCWKQPFALLNQELWVLADGVKTDALEAAFVHLGRAIGMRLNREFTPLAGQATSEKLPDLRWASLKLASVVQ